MTQNFWHSIAPVFEEGKAKAGNGN